MFGRTEDKIRKLSEQLLAAKDDDEMTLILGELRAALHEYVERLRTRIATYPILVERRNYSSRKEMSDPGSSYDSHPK